MLHILISFRLEYSFAPLLDCATLPSMKENSRHYYCADLLIFN